MKRENLSILLIGSLSGPVNGAMVLFQQLINSLSFYEGIEVKTIDTFGVRKNIVKGTIRLFSIILKLWRETKSVDVVSLHGVITGLYISGMIVSFFAWFHHKPLIIRRFGGKHHNYLGFIRSSIINRLINHADMYLVETKALVQAHENEGINNVKWYPNNRPITNIAISYERRFKGRFVYIGRISAEKGIVEIIEATNKFNNNIFVDFYGPFDDGLSERIFFNSPFLQYKGILTPTDVVSTLCNYDVLLLPTFYFNEGYPGVIIEAYRAGLPVITTRMEPLTEIVDESCGILIEPKNPDLLYKAMKLFYEDNQLYSKLTKGVMEKRKMFDSEQWTNRFIEFCKESMKEGEK